MTELVLLLLTLPNLTNPNLTRIRSSYKVNFGHLFLVILTILVLEALKIELNLITEKLVRSGF